MFNSTCDLKHLKAYTALRELSLPNANTKDSQLHHLAYLSQLQKLTLGGPFTSKGLGNLKFMPYLTHLIINSKAQLSPEIVKYCPCLVHLEGRMRIDQIEQYTKYCQHLTFLKNLN
eukprot:TRINITY_DN16557_c0_g1_i1.p1 TRINITY_DN16557_c0_g1~~TRINITY_DN16557_c0_g1_i1.p1  ORF type:complete len:116 (-),score=20.58 TRINITY_DN16557_c0_g1_i1:72-419(-)